MIYLILQSYLTIILSITLGAIGFFSLGVYFIIKKPKLKKSVPLKQQATEPLEVVEDKNVAMSHLEAIAGEDVLATQLDLARAYLETGRTQLARTILESVILQGSSQHQQEAQQLLSSI